MQMQKETQNTTLLQKPIDVLRFKGVTSQKGKNVFRLQSRRSLSHQHNRCFPFVSLLSPLFLVSTCKHNCAVCSLLTSPGFLKSKVILKVTLPFADVNFAKSIVALVNGNCPSVQRLHSLPKLKYIYFEIILISTCSQRSTFTSYSMSIYWPCHLLCIVCVDKWIKIQGLR